MSELFDWMILLSIIAIQFQILDVSRDIRKVCKTIEELE